VDPGKMSHQTSSFPELGTLALPMSTTWWVDFACLAASEVLGVPSLNALMAAQVTGLDEVPLAENTTSCPALSTGKEMRYCLTVEQLLVMLPLPFTKQW